MLQCSAAALLFPVIIRSPRDAREEQRMAPLLDV